jgi:hypothetical protein
LGVPQNIGQADYTWANPRPSSNVQLAAETKSPRPDGKPGDACGCQKKVEDDLNKCVDDYPWWNVTPQNVADRGKCNIEAYQQKSRCVFDCAQEGPKQG